MPDIVVVTVFLFFSLYERPRKLESTLSEKAAVAVAVAFTRAVVINVEDEARLEEERANTLEKKVLSCLHAAENTRPSCVYYNREETSNKILLHN